MLKRVKKVRQPAAAERGGRSRGDFAVIGDASDGTEALGLVVNLRPDILLLDVRVPGLSGPAGGCDVTGHR